MRLDILWLVWILFFVVLEGVAVIFKPAGLHPLTYWIVRVLEPLGELGIALLIGAAGWFAFHIARRIYRKDRDG